MNRAKETTWADVLRKVEDVIDYLGEIENNGWSLFRFVTRDQPRDSWGYRMEPWEFRGLENILHELWCIREDLEEFAAAILIEMEK